MDFKEEMEKSLSLLKQDGLTEWSDAHILAGQNISEKIKENIDSSDIIVFLFSSDFINSNECKKEWDRVKESGNNQIRIPIIVRECSWKNYSDAKELLCLPNDAIPISEIGVDKGFHQVYLELKNVIEELKNDFTVRENVFEEFQKTDFISDNSIDLRESFVFPTLVKYESTINIDTTIETKIKDAQQLLQNKLLIIHGEERSGKTILSRHVFFHLLDNEQSVLFINLKDIERKVPNEKLFKDEYEKQFKGDFSRWSNQYHKTIIFDDLTQNSLRHVLFAQEYFDNIIVFTTDILFQSYFHDEEGIINFTEIEIKFLSHVSQETLIRKRLKLLQQSSPNSDVQVDHIENKINEIIIKNGIVPRYPFYILSILQTHEDFMPSNLEISSYGNCYYVLIVANLIKSGIDKKDAALDSCFNFCEELAYKKYLAKKEKKAFNFLIFYEEYNEKYLLSNSIFNRLKDEAYGLFNEVGYFKNKYMYYFFLGKYFSKNTKDSKKILDEILEKSYIESNSLILLFLLHHLKDDELIEHILLHTMCLFDDIDDTEPVKLYKNETKVLESVLKKIKTNVLENNVVQERTIVREKRDMTESINAKSDEIDEEDNPEFINDIYKVLKNNKLLGQILRNKSGSLKREQLSEIITTISNSGLRLAGLLLDENEINKTADYLHMKHETNPNNQVVLTSDDIKKQLTAVVFLWVISNIEQIVQQLNIPDLSRFIVDEISKIDTPAYDLIGYFVRLDSTTNLDKTIANELKKLFKKHDDKFIKKILSHRTQWYLNTHKINASTEQKIYSTLGFKYKPKLRDKN